MIKFTCVAFLIAASIVLPTVGACANCKATVNADEGSIRYEGSYIKLPVTVYTSEFNREWERNVSVSVFVSYKWNLAGGTPAEGSGNVSAIIRVRDQEESATKDLSILALGPASDAHVDSALVTMCFVNQPTG